MDSVLNSLKSSDSNFSSPLTAIPRPVKTYHHQSYPRINPSNTSFDARGKTVFVTAGATGIGLEITKAFAEVGVSAIHFLARNLENMNAAKETLSKSFPTVKFEAHSASLTDFIKVQQIVQTIGKIDLLVLSAADPVGRGSASDVTTADVDTSFATNVTGNVNLVQTFLKLPAEGQRIVLNVSSFMTHSYFPECSSYSSSKAAFTMMFQFFATEIRARDVRFHSFHPGIVYTPAVEKFIKKEDATWWEADELPGNFAVWLASPEAEFLNGRLAWAQWDVDELVALKQKVIEDPYFLKLGLAL
ncbi:NAD(P)-binding protein [Polychaeton citri CBS 116435]|uniref:NAD(P)-binding protein n=1 Tax=Polychaeton citri CBS 116435 TaxID=1314669 RepID=A0A9P4PZT7_9PEZI|nr:NAD(P)-binding protein [Polychaeton citri CBS 116435]